MLAQYFYETYRTLLFIFNLGWALFLILTFMLGALLLNDYSDFKYMASMRYYGIIAWVILFIIGILGSVFLPSTEVVGLLLGVKP